MNHLDRLIATIQAVSDTYTKASGFTKAEITYTTGRVYHKIIIKNPHRSVYGFVRIADGAIFRAASWKAPDLDNIKGYLHEFSPYVIGAYGITYDKIGSYGVRTQFPQEVQHLFA